MNKVEQFLQKHGLKVVIFLLVLTYMKSCGVDREVTKVKKQLIALDSLATKRILKLKVLRLKNA
jgi:hypothetical protein